MSRVTSQWRAEWKRARWLSPVVRERRRFMVNEFLGQGNTREYHLRARDAVAVLRHNRYDASVLHETLRDSFYTPPPEVRAMLSRLGRGPRVLDLGGNIGCFGLLLLDHYPSTHITAFEPDPANLEILHRCIARNDRQSRWRVIEACATAEDGETPFVGGQASHSRMPHQQDYTGDPPTMTVSTVDVFPHMHGIDLLKMDIEGGEWAVLDDPRFAEVRPAATLLEWHSYDCPEDNPRRAASGRLESLGYTVLHEKPPPVPDSESLYGAGALWAWLPENI